MITSELLAKIFPDTPARLRERFLDALNKYLPEYGIDNYLRVCAFLATAGVETDYLKTTVEYHSGANYEGRRDLGNTERGDGRRFRGRGVFQTTGRFNYARVNERVGKKLGINFLKNPERLAEIEIAVESACIFWQDNNLSKYADKGDFRSLSAVVNCGDPKARPNHWAKRNELYSLCKRRVPTNFSFTEVSLQKNNDTNPANNILPAAAVPEPEKSKFKTFLEKYGQHCQGDSIRNIAGVALARASSPVAALWYFGLSGKILLIVFSLLILGCASRAAYKYRDRLKSWFEDIQQHFLGEV